MLPSGYPVNHTGSKEVYGSIGLIVEGIVSFAVVKSRVCEYLKYLSSFKGDALADLCGIYLLSPFANFAKLVKLMFVL